MVISRKNKKIQNEIESLTQENIRLKQQIKQLKQKYEPPISPNDIEQIPILCTICGMRGMMTPNESLSSITCPKCKQSNFIIQK